MQRSLATRSVYVFVMLLMYYVIFMGRSTSKVQKDFTVLFSS